MMIKIKRMMKSNLLLSFLITSFFLILALVFCDVKYEVSDDFVMETILSGAYSGEVNPYMIFVNVIFGKLLSYFYLFFPAINWYTISLICIGFFSSMGVCYLIFKRFSILKAWVFIALFFICFSDDIFILLQFTKTSAIGIISGSLLFIDSIFNNGRKLQLICGAILTIFGSLLRFNSIFIAASFILFILLYEYFRLFKSDKDIAYKKSVAIKSIFCGIGLIAVVLICREINITAYNMNPEYKQFREFSLARSSIVDYPVHTYEDNGSELSTLGYSWNDYQMLTKWNFSDSEFFTVESLNSVSKILKEYRETQWVSIRGTTQKIFERGYQFYPVFWGCLATFVLLSVLLRKNSLKLLVPICISGALIFYFFYISRVVYRVEYGIFACCFLTQIYLHNDLNYGIIVWKMSKNLEKSICSTLLIACTALRVFFYIPDNSYKYMSDTEYRNYVLECMYYSADYDFDKYRISINKRPVQGNLINLIENDKENFYYLNFQSTIQTLYLDYSPFLSLGKNYYRNMIYMVGVTTEFPDINYVLEQNGINNIMKDLVRDDIYVIDNHNHEFILTYLREHYYPAAKMKLINEVDGYKIWKFTEG